MFTFVYPSLHNFFSQLLNYLFPAPCLVCGLNQTSSLLLCAPCEDQLPKLGDHRSLCKCCSLPLPATNCQDDVKKSLFCGQCAAKPPAFHTSTIPFSYTHPVDLLIQEFKYRGKLASGHLLAKLLLKSCKVSERPNFLVPAPMHWRRRWQRGFNQTELLSMDLGNALNLPVLLACEQIHPAQSQKGLSRKERQMNLKRVFRVNPKMKKAIRGAHIALVDDVVTTTATARSLSAVLMDAGAKRVDIWALARTPISR